MTIALTRDKVLTLMRELPTNHWFQTELMEELIQLNNATETTTVTRIHEPVHEENIIYPGGTVDTGECVWETYGFVCRKNTVDGTKFCTDHAHKKCFCGAPATHGCNVELQFVCGGPLCEAHRMCNTH